MRNLPPEIEVRALRGPLLRWYRRNRRDLPWRRTRDPYAIWVSEIMLQQTRVAAVLPYYERFLERFPDVPSLARATEEAVLALWSGLGYYGRARALRAGAVAVMERHGGLIPDDAKVLLALPGVGPYTAGAIASLAYGRQEPVLDGNVRRVLSRLFAIRLRSGGRGERILWLAARTLVRGAAPGDLNQALMELGALVCTARNPRCPVCPVARCCLGRASGRPDAFPGKRAHPKVEEVRVAVALVLRRGRVLLERHVGGTPLRGSWDLPALEIPADADPRAEIEAELHRRHRLQVRAGGRTAGADHSILRRRLSLEVFACRLVQGHVRRSSGLRWLDPNDLDQVPVSGATRKILRSTAPSVAAARGRGGDRSGRISLP